MKIALLFLPAFTWLLAIPAAADALTLDFEGLDDLQVVSTEFAGLVFSNAIALRAGFAGGSLNEFENPPRSGVTVIADDGAPIEIEFLVPVTEFSGFLTYNTTVTLTALDAGGAVLGSVNSLFSNNQLLSGFPGATPNEKLVLQFSEGISKVLISGSPGGNSFTLDDVTTITAVAEPGSLALLIAVCASLLALRPSSRKESHRR
jgi:hypothetical protein